jgi:Ca-activated chloride channel family protein
MRPAPLVLAALLTLSLDALAQGIVLERVRETLPTPPPRGPLPLVLVEHRLRVRVVDQVAEIDVEQVFANRNPWEMEGVYLYPLPRGAAASRFAMTMGGRTVEGEVLDARRAREIYRSIVHARRDPGLLEFAGCGLLRASVFPIPANGETRVALRYAQVLAPEGGLVELVAPMRFRAFRGGAARVHGEIDVQAAAGVGAFFSPTHRLEVVRKSGGRVVASFEEARSFGETDFRLLYALDDRDFGVSVAAHRVRGEDGYFLMLLAPRVEIAASDVSPKDVVFVVDTSGSMGERGGAKIAQARAALAYALGRLDRRDRFQVVAFSTEARPFRNALVEANEDNVAAAVHYAKGLVAAGGTAIHDALRVALAIPRAEGRVPIVLFLTDGQPTVGVTDADAIVRDAVAANAAGARLFVFGVGDDVNARLLSELAERNRGATSFVAETENIEVKVSALVDKIAAPVLADARVEVEGLGAYDLFPQRLGDLFRGQQASLVGRFRNGGPRALRLTGRIGAREVAFTYEASFGEGAGNDFVARLWAVRKVGFLLDEIRKNGESKELIDEVTRLGTRYGIVTPYTSFLAVEEAELRRAAVPPGLRGPDDPSTDGPTLAFPERAREALRSGAGSGAGAVAAGRIAESLKAEEVGDAVAGTGVKIAGEKTFRLVGGVWLDAELPEKFEAKRVAYLSAEYDALLEDAALARYLSVGERVVVLYGGVVYEVVPG